MVPANILFTLPTLSPIHSKLPRVLAIAKALDRRRFQPIVSVDHAGRLHPDGLRLFKEIEVPVQLIRMSPHGRETMRSLLEMTKTPAILKKSRIAIQYSSDYSRSWTEPLLARLGGVQHWVTIKTNTEIDGWDWRLRLSLAERVIVEAPQVANLLIGTIPSIENRIILIPKGVDTEAFSPKSRDKTLGNDLALDPNDLVLGCVAHLVHYKDHPSLLRALKILDRADIKLLLIGSDIDAIYAQELRRLVNNLELEQRVYFLGQRSDISRLHGVMDGLILTSGESEASPTAVLEGMSSGLPIISSDVGGLNDAVKDGVNGWVVPRGEGFVERLAAAIESWSLDSERRTTYGIASRRIVQERFSLMQMTQGYVHLFESLLEQKG